ncbi:MAG TPA: hypothetical protein V6D05_06270 [Stenomitos sp.]
MFEPEVDLVTTHRVELSTGEAVVFDQSLWGKVIEVREVQVGPGRYWLDDYVATARLRQLLEATTVGGEWVFEEGHALCAELRAEIQELIARFQDD